MDYVPARHYPPGQEIAEQCQAIARRYDLYQLGLFQTTATATVWDTEEGLWYVTTDVGMR